MNESTYEDGRRQSILKQRIRAPLQEVPQLLTDDETTTTLTHNRRVSFGRKLIKEFIVGSAADTQAFHEYEQSSESVSEQSTDCSGPLDLVLNKSCMEGVDECFGDENLPPDSFCDPKRATSDQRVRPLTECLGLAMSMLEDRDTVIIIGSKSASKDDQVSSIASSFSDQGQWRYAGDSRLGISPRSKSSVDHTNFVPVKHPEMYAPNPSKSFDKAQFEFLDGPLGMASPSVTLPKDRPRSHQAQAYHAPNSESARVNSVMEMTYVNTSRQLSRSAVPINHSITTDPHVYNHTLDDSSMDITRQRSFTQCDMSLDEGVTETNIIHFNTAADDFLSDLNQSKSHNLSGGNIILDEDPFQNDSPVSLLRKELANVREGNRSFMEQCNELSKSSQNASLSLDSPRPFKATPAKIAMTKPSFVPSEESLFPRDSVDMDCTGQNMSLLPELTPAKKYTLNSSSSQLFPVEAQDILSPDDSMDMTATRLNISLPLESRVTPCKAVQPENDKSLTSQGSGEMDVTAPSLSPAKEEMSLLADLNATKDNSLAPSAFPSEAQKEPLNESVDMEFTAHINHPFTNLTPSTNESVPLGLLSPTEDIIISSQDSEEMDVTAPITSAPIILAATPVKLTIIPSRENNPSIASSQGSFDASFSSLPSTFSNSASKGKQPLASSTFMSKTLSTTPVKVVSIPHQYQSPMEEESPQCIAEEEMEGMVGKSLLFCDEDAQQNIVSSSSTAEKFFENNATLHGDSLYLKDVSSETLEGQADSLLDDHGTSFAKELQNNEGARVSFSPASASSGDLIEETEGGIIVSPGKYLASSDPAAACLSGSHVETTLAENISISGNHSVSSELPCVPNVNVECSEFDVPSESLHVPITDNNQQLLEPNSADVIVSCKGDKSSLSETLANVETSEHFEIVGTHQTDCLQNLTEQDKIDEIVSKETDILDVGETEIANAPSQIQTSVSPPENLCGSIPPSVPNETAADKSRRSIVYEGEKCPSPRAPINTNQSVANLILDRSCEAAMEIDHERKEDKCEQANTSLSLEPKAIESGTNISFQIVGQVEGDKIVAQDCFKDLENLARATQFSALETSLGSMSLSAPNETTPDVDAEESVGQKPATDTTNGLEGSLSSEAPLATNKSVMRTSGTSSSFNRTMTSEPATDTNNDVRNGEKSESETLPENQEAEKEVSSVHQTENIEQNVEHEQADGDIESEDGVAKRLSLGGVTYGNQTENQSFEERNTSVQQEVLEETATRFGTRESFTVHTLTKVCAASTPFRRVTSETYNVEPTLNGRDEELLKNETYKVLKATDTAEKTFAIEHSGKRAHVDSPMSEKHSEKKSRLSNTPKMKKNTGSGIALLESSTPQKSLPDALNLDDGGSKCEKTYTLAVVHQSKRAHSDSPMAEKHSDKKGRLSTTPKLPKTKAISDVANLEPSTDIMEQDAWDKRLSDVFEKGDGNELDASVSLNDTSLTDMRNEQESFEPAPLSLSVARTLIGEKSLALGNTMTVAALPSFAAINNSNVIATLPEKPEISVCDSTVAETPMEGLLNNTSEMASSPEVLRQHVVSPSPSCSFPALSTQANENALPPESANCSFPVPSTHANENAPEKQEKPASSSTTVSTLSNLMKEYKILRKQSAATSQKRVEPSTSRPKRLFSEAPANKIPAESKVHSELLMWSKEPGCLWSLEYFQACSLQGTGGELKFRFPLLKDNCLLSIQFSKESKNCRIHDLRTSHVVSEGFQFPKQKITEAFGYSAFKDFVKSESDNLKSNFEELPFCMIRFNSFCKKLCKVLEQTLTVLKGYAGSRLINSGLRFRVISYSLDFICVIEINLARVLALGKPKLVFEHTMGHFNENEANRILANFWQGECPMLCFIRAVVDHIIRQERAVNFVTKRPPLLF